MDDSIYQWLERLGGWAVVLMIVRWMMTRIDNMIDGFKEALARFAAFEEAEHETHRSIVETQERILEKIEEVNRKVR